MAQFRLDAQPLTACTCFDQARTGQLVLGELAIALGNNSNSATQIQRRQVVDFKPGRSGMPASSWQYKVVRLFPRDGSDLVVVLGNGHLLSRSPRSSWFRH
jgi:hypothetical protein